MDFYWDRFAFLIMYKDVDKLSVALLWLFDAYLTITFVRFSLCSVCLLSTLYMGRFGIWVNLDVAITFFPKVIKVLFYILCFLSFKKHFTNQRVQGFLLILSRKFIFLALIVG